MKQLLKYAFLFCVGGAVYILIELLFRGFSHWSMYILGGICFICLGLINEVLPWETPFILQMIIGGAVITALELLTGYVVNIQLGWGVWDYSELPLNFRGQICLSFSLLWCLLSAVGIVLDDWVRYWIDLLWRWILRKFFKKEYTLREEKPHYKLWFTCTL